MSRHMVEQVEADACVNQPHAVSFQETMLDIHSELATRDFEALKFLCSDFIPLGTLENIKFAIGLIAELQKLCLIEAPNKVAFLAELLWHIGRNDLLKKLKYNVDDVKLRLIPDPQLVHVSQYRLMLHYLCQELTRQECDTLKFMCERDIPRARLESIQGPQDFFRVLESQHKLSADRMDYLLHRLRHLNRQDLVRKAEQFRNTHQSAHLSTVDDVYSENIAVSLKPAATHDYRKDDADLEENFAPRDVLVRQHQQLRRQTDCQIEDNRTTVDERTIHLTSRQMETGLLLNRESYGDLRQSVGINEEVFNTGRRNGVQGSRNHDADMPCYSMRRKPRVGGDPCSTQMPNREGTKVDQENLEATFKNLDFVVECFVNLTHDEMTAELQRMSRTDHSSYDCFVCCILSHGTLGSVYGVNGKTASVRDLMSCVKPAYCPTLRDKPKIFFIQACQGSEKQGGFDVETDSSDVGSPETIPNEADFLLGLATVPGFVSYRSRSQGSWYITTLVRLLDLYAYSHDLLTILTRVNYDVSRAYTKDGGNKQVPQPAYTLRKRLLFQ